MLPLFLCSFPKFLSWRTHKVTLHIPGHMWKCYLFTYTNEQSLFEKLIVFQRVKKYPVFSGTRRFIATFTSARHVSLSWVRSIQSMPPPSYSWRFIFILSSNLRLRLPSGLFPSDLPTKILHIYSAPVLATWPAHLIILDLFTQIILGEEYRS